METNWIKELANAGFLWGPFFFSILFMLVITRTAHSYYAKVVERTSPPADAEEKKLYANYFKLSIACGIVMVFLSVGWWIFGQLQRNNTFEGAIVGLDPNINLIPTEDGIYLRPTETQIGKGKYLRDYHFAIISDKPFEEGQKFRLDYYPEVGSIGDEKPQPVPLYVEYQGKFKNAGKYHLASEGSLFRLVRLENERGK